MYVYVEMNYAGNNKVVLAITPGSEKHIENIYCKNYQLHNFSLRHSYIQ